MSGENAHGVCAIEARGIAYSYGKAPVFENVSLRLHAGRVAFLEGRNGGGKSTLLRCLAGWASPARGEVLVEGAPFDPRNQAQRAKIAFVPDIPAFYDDLTAREHMAFACTTMNRASYEPRALALAESFGLADDLERFPYTYSRGMKQKFALAMALALEPPVLLLDEPFSPIDPASARVVSAAIAHAAAKGAAVFLSCHHDVPDLAPDAVFRLEGGRLR